MLVASCIPSMRAGFLFFYLQRSLLCISLGVQDRGDVTPSIHVLLLSITLHAACCALTCALATSSLMNINFKEEIIIST